MNKHAMANEYKILCSEANKMVKMPNDTFTSNGWEKVNSEYSRNSNFKGVLYEKGGHYALCFVGTDVKNVKDWGANLKMGVTGDSTQIKQAQKFTDDMIHEYGLNSENTVSIGHSEGGTEAAVVGIQNGMRTVTFNAYGVGKRYIDQNKNYGDLVTNYRDPHDPISKLKENVSTTYITPSMQNDFMSKTPFGSVQAHKLDYMGDCKQSVPVNEYKSTHPLFINKISDTNITRDDIANMDSDLFRVYENEIDNRMANNQIGTFVPENATNPYGFFGKNSGINFWCGDKNYSQHAYNMNGNNKSPISNKRSNSSSSSSSSGKGSSSGGKWVTINGNHVLIKD